MFAPPPRDLWRPPPDAGRDRARTIERARGALLELLRGFQAVDEASRGQHPGDLQHIFRGLLTVLLRLVFLRYAEDRGLMPGEPTRVTDLHRRLRDDAGRDPDAMDRRFGAWSTLLALFRRIDSTHDRLHLFAPDHHSCLERVSDGVVWRVLEALLVREDPRSDRDVEQLGAIYESMLGLTLARARGPSIAVRPRHSLVDLADLLSQEPDARARHLKDRTGCDLAGPALAAARSIDDLVAALGRKLSPRAPAIVPAGALYLQPGDERRRSGAHYTPRSLTEPVVRTALRPVLEALGQRPTPQQLLDLKLCDPAMGSGAFLLEAARQLGQHLRRAWDEHDATPHIPPGDDPDLHARRLVAQRCLHGVDRDPIAVDLARLSLWLVTGARDHPFTFLDHALKHGDSLVGLDRDPVAAIVDDPLADPRMIADAVIHAFFAEDRDRRREQRRAALLRETVEPARAGDPRARHRLAQLQAELRGGARPITPFHWALEFPDVFNRDNPGFDCAIGNPPFLGGTMISSAHSRAYLAWLASAYPGSGNRMDLAAYFLRRAFDGLRGGGTLGLVTTNTIAQGDTRSGGLRWICQHSGTIYSATRRLPWPGLAAVTVSLVHVRKGPAHTAVTLDERPVDRISAFLSHAGGDDDPAPLADNAGYTFEGYKPAGQGFIFDDADDAANPESTLRALLKKDPRNAERISPYLGGAELNQHPTHAPSRHIINFGDMDERAAGQWPDLLDLVRQRVKPQRDIAARDGHRRYWWRFGETRPGLTAALRGRARILATARVSPHLAFAFLPAGYIYSEQLVLVAVDTHAALATLQSRVHEVWARFFGSSLEDRLRYTPSDCFDTFPFPPDWQRDPALEHAGERYHHFRADLMRRDDEGLTATYNRFHDPDDRAPEILTLRERHAAIDRAVLTAYGWTDLAARAAAELPRDHRWPQELHDEVLARLLERNHRRAAEERRAPRPAALVGTTGVGAALAGPGAEARRIADNRVRSPSAARAAKRRR